MNCVSDTYSEVLGAASAETCLVCHSNSYALPGSPTQANCSCNAGFYESGVLNISTCTPCPAGTFKPGASNADVTSSVCTNCAIGTHSATLGAMSRETCQACHLHSSAPPGSSGKNNCTCDPGFAYDANPQREAVVVPSGFNNYFYISAMAQNWNKNEIFFH